MRALNFSALQETDESSDGLLNRFSAEGRWAQPPSLWQEQDPEELLLRAETVDCLDDAIARLPASQRAVVTLRDLEGMEAHDVCNILELSETNQRVLLHRARIKVRAMLDEHLKRNRADR